MNIIVILLISLMVFALILKVSLVEVYHLKLKGDKDAKGKVAFNSVFARGVSYNLQRYLLMRELPPFPASYSTYLKYQTNLKRLNRFLLFCLFLLMMIAFYVILKNEINGE